MCYFSLKAQRTKYMNKIKSLEMQIWWWWWWYNLKHDCKSKYERIRYLMKRRLESNSKIPNDEFHPSLDICIRDVLAMTSDERDDYYRKLVIKRNLAHEADNERSSNQKHP